MKRKRSSVEIEAQKKSFLALLPKETPGDFAAQCQIRSWQTHLRNLDIELGEAKQREAKEVLK